MEQSIYHFYRVLLFFPIPPEIKELFGRLREVFNIDKGAEISVEIDPWYLSEGQLETLREVGFIRVSMGLQREKEKEFMV